MILILHITSVIASFIIILFADHYGFTWIQGKNKFLDKRKLFRFHLYTWIGLLCIISTGGIMFYSDYQTLLSSTVFLLKMSFVGALLVNAISIGFFINVAEMNEFRNLSTKEKIPLFIAGGTSTLCWVGALVCAFFIY